MSKVLIVESDAWLAGHYGRQLESAGFSVVRATSAGSAMDKIDDEVPSVVIMNLLLDGPVGIGLLHELQSYIDTADIPVIVASNVKGVSLDDLRPYGVRRLLDTATMKPSDIVTTVKSVLSLEVQ